MRSGRYRAEGPEAEYEPGSRGRVLRNRLGVRSVREMAARESAALLAATQHAAMERDYRPMTATFRGVIARSLRTQVTASSARGRS